MKSSYSLIFDELVIRGAHNIQHSQYEILQVVSIAAFDRTSLAKGFTNENYQYVIE